jgi:hypothetical protein
MSVVVLMFVLVLQLLVVKHIYTKPPFTERYYVSMEGRWVLGTPLF